MGWGGARAGSGRKPKDATLAAIHGSIRGRQRQEKSRRAPKLPVFTVDPPADLSAEQMAVWVDLAPHALAARTLTPGTAAAFRDLCEAIVFRRALFETINRDGLTYVKVMVDGAGTEHEELKAHPLISQHRGMMQRVEAGLARFKLAPMGKEIVQPAPTEADPFAEFEAETQH